MTKCTSVSAVESRRRSPSVRPRKRSHFSSNPGSIRPGARPQRTDRSRRRRPRPVPLRDRSGRAIDYRNNSIPDCAVAAARVVPPSPTKSRNRMSVNSAIGRVSLSCAWRSAQKYRRLRLVTSETISTEFYFCPENWLILKRRPRNR